MGTDHHEHVVGCCLAGFVVAEDGAFEIEIEAQDLVFDADGFARLDVPIEEETWAAREMTRVGAEVEVLEPVTLRERMTEIARKLANFYGV